MFSSALPILGLALLFTAPAALAEVHDIQVGGANGETKFDPEAIVRAFYSLILSSKI